MERLKVELGERSYPIEIAAGLLQHAEVLTQTIKGKRVMIVTNTVVAPLYLERIIQLLSGFQVEHLILPDGEAYKTLATFERIMSALLETNHGRDTTLIALGACDRGCCRLCCGKLPTWHSFYSSAYHTALPG